MIILTLLAFGLNPVAAEVIVEPFGAAVLMEEEVEEFIINLANTGEQEVSFEIGINLVDMEDQDERLAGPCRDRRGGPQEDDDFEYEWRDNLENDGPEFEWIDVREFDGVRQFNLGDDQNTGRIDLGWEFPFYDRVFDFIYVDSDGWASFVNQSQSIRTAYPFPSNDQAWFFTLAVLNGDWDGNRDGAGPLFFWSNGEDEAVITYNNWCPRHNEQIGGCFQIILNNEGMITYQYGDEIEGAQRWWGDSHTGVNGYNGFGFQMVARAGGQGYIVEDRAIGCGPRDAWIHWIMIAPEEGAIEPESNLDLTVTLITEGEEADVYYAIVEIELDTPEQPLIEIPVVMSIESPVFRLFGAVTDEDGGAPVEIANVSTEPFDIRRHSDEEGGWEITDLPRGEYEITFTATDYLPHTEAVQVEEDEEFELNFALLHSECNPDVEDITFEIAPDTDLQTSFEISNDGNGPLNYTVERRLLGDANADPWTLRLSHMFGQDRDDSRIQGVVFADDRFYVAGAHGNEPAIYIFDREGEYIDLFIQPGEDRYGMKDLAWDGRLIWGAIGQTIYGMTLDGDVEVEFEGPFRPTSNLAWDPEHELLWISATTSDIAGIDRNGNLVSELDRQGLRMYGFGYWPDDPDDSPLYIFNKVREVGDQVVHKMNVDNGELTEVSILEPESGGSAAGAFITNEYDIYSWVFIAVANNGADDRVDIWQIDARKEWFLLDPTEGVIEADNTQEFNLTLDATGLPPEVFEGELVFLHDGVGSETHIPITLSVVEGPVQAERTIQLEIGWNMVSVNLQPDPDDIRVLMRELVEADLLLLMKDGQGRFYSPEFDFCNIPGWNVADGYQMKMDDAGEVTLAGITVMADDAIPLTEGWNLISYYPRSPIDAIVALSGIEDRLLMAKDGWGRFYNPEWGFSNMGDMLEGSGYQVKVSEDLELIYRFEAEDDEFAMNVQDLKGKLPAQPMTGSNMSLLVKGGSISDGEIGVYANGELVGSGVLEDGICGIAVWGDDPTTSEIDGALGGELLELKLLDENGLHPVQFEMLAGDNAYQIDGFWAIELIDDAILPDEFGIVSAYPNPFNSRTVVKYALPEAGIVNLSVFDLNGRRVMEVASEQQEAGVHSVIVDGAVLVSGIYFVKLQTNEKISNWKIALMK